MHCIKSLLFAALSCCMMLAVGCSFDLHDPKADEYEVQIIGDSIFDFSGDVQTILKTKSGKMYKDRSVSGEKIAGILDQYDRAIAKTPTMKTVLADGGGNDILQGSMDCESDPLTQGCIDVIDYVADRMEVLFEEMYQDGVADCLWLGYYYLKDGQAEKNEALDYAYTLYDSVIPDASLNLYGPGGLHAIDPRPHIQPQHIKSDDIHPTWSGSEILADLLWDVMVQEDTYR